MIPSIRVLLGLLLLTTCALAGESLKQKLEQFVLPLPRPAADTLVESLARLSFDYQAQYQEPLRIYFSIEFMLQAKAPAKEPEKDLPHIPGLDPITLGPPDPSIARLDSGPTQAPASEVLRYLTSLCGVAFTVHDDFVLIHPRPDAK